MEEAEKAATATAPVAATAAEAAASDERRRTLDEAERAVLDHRRNATRGRDKV